MQSSNFFLRRKKKKRKDLSSCENISLRISLKRNVIFGNSVHNILIWKLSGLGTALNLERIMLFDSYSYLKFDVRT
jgi:hypothetical protein